ncbi:MAG: ABC transporter permease subunit [Planctomycetia bacterium]
MQSRTTFTGRSRRRKTTPWVRAGDSLARGLITFGGIGTIVAVLAVGIFLFAVAVPLFKPARIRFQHVMPVSQGTDGATGMGVDESGLVAWLLDATGGRVRIFSVADGAPLGERSAADCGLEGATAIQVLPSGLHAACGFADGSLRTGRLGLESSFVPEADLPSGLTGMRIGEVRPVGDSIYLRSLGGQHARIEFVADFPGQPSRTLSTRIIDIDLAIVAGGPLVAALDAEGRIRVESASSRRNLLTDEIITSVSGATIEPGDEAGGTAEAQTHPLFVRVSELGDQLFVIAADGTARRHAIRNIERPEAMETFDAATGEAPVSAVARMFGGNALAIGDDAGAVRIFFTTRGGEKPAADGLTMAAAKAFPETGRRITALGASPRSRLLAVADATGTIRLVQTTTGRTVLDTGRHDPLEASARQVLISPRENRLLAADGAVVAAWSFDPGYPEVSLRSLFGRVWYENYPAAVHAWETTGHESFEAKFGLVPLVFGTIKATLYSMLFATPIAILAAIYSSQFLHPSWKARIKPMIEMMASLPSVVLGFIAGLVLAPVIEKNVMEVLTGIYAVPLALVAGAHLWQMLPGGLRTRLGGWRFAAIGLFALPAGLAAARAAAPWLERLLFQGDIATWLDGRGGSGLGGWVLAVLPLACIGATMIVGRMFTPWLRRRSGRWSPQQAAAASLATFVIGLGLAAALALAAAMLLDALRLDTRGGLLGTYVQRNSLVVAIGMSFAIIPLVFTIADDALAAVPAHLRSASLGAGATPWQTAVRVIVPAAASGLFSAVMIGLGRAVGETMIVLMAAGNTPLMNWNLFNGFQTLSAAIATELPEAARGTSHYRVLFLAALVLFAITFVVNTLAEIVRQRFRKRAHDL